MATDITRDIVVDSEEWASLLQQLENKDKSIREMLDKFIDALDILVNNGFISGNRKKNMEVFKQEVEKLRSQLDGVYDSAKSSITTLTKGTDAVDHYNSAFPWL